MATDKKLQKLEQTEDSWETNAPNDEFYGYTLAQYKARVDLSRDARETVASLYQQYKAAKTNMDDIDKENLAIEKNVAKAIAGDEKYGDDSALYEGTGRVRKSERKTGLTRKKGTSTPTP